MPNNLCILTHVYNEEMLIVPWMKHHSMFARELIVIDHHSTDKTVELVNKYAPYLYDKYKVVTTKLDCFDAALVDQEVMELETTRESEWVFTLNVTEFIWHFDLPYLLENTSADAIGFRAFMMVDPVSRCPKEPSDLSGFIWHNRTYGYRDDGSALASRRARFMHRKEHGSYALGRHGVNIPNHDFQEHYNILFAHFSPWPESRQRKLQIQDRIPLKDKQAGSGIQHLQTPESLNGLYWHELTKAKDLLTTDQDFAKNYNRYLDWMDTP